MVHLEFKLIRKGNVNIREKSQQIRSLYVGDFRLFEGNEISEVLKFFRLVKKKRQILEARELLVMKTSRVEMLFQL